MKRRISIGEPIPNPTAQICINKSRLKVYNKETSPTYYLEKGQEFQIELFNSTKNTVLAKIQLNGKAISQGGLVLKPGQRVFLERYLDVAKKFMFDTYEVSNTEEVKKAIEDNGDFKVEFYKESNPTLVYGSVTTYNNSNPFTLTNNTATYNGYLNLTGGITSTYSTNGPINCGGSLTSNITNDSFEPIQQKPRLRKSLTKSIETGRVEAGSSSDQKFEYVNKSFDYYAFHTVVCKLLPVSQKINTAEDINVKRYCTNCGTKQKPEFKFCPSCGKKC
jgi:Zn finger protein HypA/HybF involved in hydrogenase expression